MQTDLNYYETFIQIAPDCPVKSGIVPAAKAGKKTVPVLEYAFISSQPYGYTQEELLFAVHVERSTISASEVAARHGELWTEFFSKAHACLRASSLAKRYGWGIHFDKDGKVAAYPVESTEYQHFAADSNLQQLVAMRNKRA